MITELICMELCGFKDEDMPLTDTVVTQAAVARSRGAENLAGEAVLEFGRLTLDHHLKTARRHFISSLH